MDIQDAVRKRLEERQTHDPHEAGETYQAHVARAQHVDDRAIVGVAVRIVPRIEADRLDARRARAYQPRCIGPIRNDDRDRGAEVARSSRIDDGLQIGTAS